MIIIKNELTGNKLADKLITEEISERLIAMVSDEIAFLKRWELLMEDGNYFSLIFPKKYPFDRCMNKIQELRERLVSREEKELDSVCKYILYSVIAINCISLINAKGVAKKQFPNRDSINRILFNSYGTLRGKHRFMPYYEDYENYPRIIFDNIDFTMLDDMSEEEIIELEELENADN